MARWLRCSCGHQWEYPQSSDTAPGTVRCPVCQAAIHFPLDGQTHGVEFNGAGNSGKTLAETADRGTAAWMGASPREARVKSGPAVPSIPGYEIVKELGHGGMGVVFLALHVRLQRHVALKMIRAGPYAGTDELVRFSTEAESAAQLHHPGIVQIYEVGETEGQPFLALEYVEGGALTGRLDGTPWHSLAAARFVEALAHAIHHAHQHGIVHRDLKPSNVLLARAEGHQDCESHAVRHWSKGVAPKIADFGLAKKLEGGSSQTQSGTILGTPSYMAPEQAGEHRSHIGPAADVYALGSLLYELLTGRPPFLAATPLDTVLQVLKQDPVPPHRLVPQTPHDLETICLKCLEKTPARRFASAAALADELRRYQDGTPILSRPVGKLERTWRWCRRNPIQAVLTGAVLSLLLALAVGASLSALWLRQERNLAQDSEQRARKSEELALENLGRAHRAEKEAVDKLWDSLLAQARALRWSGQPGRHFDSLTALGRAADIFPSLAVRNEALACLPLADFRESSACKGILTDEYSTVSFDADLERYACSDARGNISIRKTAGDQELLSLPGPGHPCWVLRFSPKGNYLAAKYHPVNFNFNNRAIVWDLKQGQKLLELERLQNGAMDFRPDESQFAFGQGKLLSLYALPGGARVKEFTLACLPNTVRFHPRDARRLAVSSLEDRMIVVLDPETGKAEKTLPLLAGVRGLAWNAAGNLLAGAGNDHRIYLWDVPRAFAPSALVGHQGPVTEVAFHPGGDLLASCGWDPTLRLWHLHTRQQLLVFNGFAVKGIPALCFSRDGRALAYTLAGRQIRTFEVHPAPECRRLPPAPQWDAHLSPDGRWLTLSQDQGVVLWDVRAAREIARWPIGATRFAYFHPEGRQLISWGTAGLHRWPLTFGPDGNCTGAGDRESLGVRATVLPEYGAMSPDGRYVATGDRTAQEVFVVDLRGNKVCFRRAFANPSRVALSPDGRWLAAAPWGAADPVVRVWDMHSGKETAAFKEPNGTRLAFTADSRWLVTGTATAYRFRAPGSAKPDRELITEGQSSGDLALHPKLPLAAVCIKPGHVRLLDTESLKEYATFPAGDPLHFNASGNQLLTLADNRVPEVWDLPALRRRLHSLKLDWETPR